MAGQEIAIELIGDVWDTVGVPSCFYEGSCISQQLGNADSERGVPLLMDIGCYSDTLSHVGENFKTPALTGFMHSWITLFSHSPKTKLLWKEPVGRSMPSYSKTKWWSKWEVVKMVMLHFDVRMKTSVLPFCDEQQKLGLLQIETAATVDWGKQFVKATYFLEGDGPLALECYEAIQKVSLHIQMGKQ